MVEIHVYDVKWLRDKGSALIDLLAEKGSEKLFAFDLTNAILDMPYPQCLLYAAYVFLKLLLSFTVFSPNSLLYNEDLYTDVEQMERTANFVVTFFVIVMLTLFYIEVKQAIAEKLDYLSSGINWLQNAVLLMCITIGVFRLAKSATIPQNWSVLTDSEYDVFVVIGPSICMFLATLEFMYILTYWRSFSFYVRMISQSASDISSFMALLFVCLAAFAVAIYLVETTQDIRFQDLHPDQKY